VPPSVADQQRSTPLLRVGAVQGREPQAEGEVGAPVAGATPGAPVLRAMVLRAERWNIEDTWYSQGFKGTGSHHISLKDVFVPDSNAIDMLVTHSNVPGVLFEGGAALFVTTHGGFAVGLAEGAIRDLIALANAGKRLLFGRSPVRDSPLFHRDLGRAQADVRAARALLNEQCEQDREDTIAGKASDPAIVTRRIQSIVWVTEACARAVETCYRLGAGSSVYESSPLQRRMRDMNAATQHASVHLRHYATAGAQLLGHPPIHPLFAA
jgi:indole-3-acetate monooxygenase